MSLDCSQRRVLGAGGADDIALPRISKMISVITRLEAREWDDENLRRHDSSGTISRISQFRERSVGQLAYPVQQFSTLGNAGGT